MHSLLITAIVFTCVFAGAIFGMRVRHRLPHHHLGSESQDAIKLGMGLIATMSALVLGLLIASAKGSFDTQATEVRQMGADTLMLDRVLAAYGPEAAETRALLRQTVGGMVGNVWRDGATREAVFDNAAIDTAGLQIFRKIHELAPKDEVQRALKDEAAEIIKNLFKERWQLLTEGRSAIPMPFLAVLVFWLTILFASFGLFAPQNATVMAAFIVCALSVAGAIFLILELDRPFEGLMQISNEPFRRVTAQ